MNIASELRQSVKEASSQWEGGDTIDLRTLTRAADEIERLTAENERLRAALTQFVAACDTAPPISIMQEIAMARKVAGEALNQQKTKAKTKDKGGLCPNCGDQTAIDRAGRCTNCGQQRVRT